MSVSSATTKPDSARVNETERTHCRRCAAPLSQGVPGGLCAACLGGDLFADEESPLPFTRIGDYELLEEIGRGGMGLVYRARQISVNRPAAVKLILTGPLASAVERQRFVAEASAAAALDHPGIVAVYEAGEEDGQPFFAMQLIEGVSLSARLSAGPRLAPRESAELMRRVAMAVQHAHERGFLHRDLKPGNILLDANGAPHVTDFGLARRVGDESHLTLTGAAVGTPAYMAPEQTDTRRPPTTAVDVYSLGAILYEMLSGQPPFSERSLPELFVAIREKEPASISAVRSEVDRDIDIICRKCLEKETARRYRTAQTFADDLQRWLSGEPITARAVGKLERLWRWCRRRPAIAGLAAAALLLALAGGAGVAWQWQRAVENAWRADDNAARESEARHNAEANTREARAALYAADMNLCQAALRANNLGRARRLLDAHRPAPGGEDMRGWEWRYLWAQCRSAAAGSLPAMAHEVRGVVCTPNGQQAVVNDDHGRLMLWDVKERKMLAEWRSGYDGGPLTATPDGRAFLAPVRKDRCELLDFEGKVLRKFPLTASLTEAAFSPDGGMLAVQSLDGSVRLFQTESAALLQEIKLPPVNTGPGGGIAFVTGDSVRLAVGSHSQLKIFRCSDGTLEREWQAHPGSFISALAVSPDAKWLATGSCFDSGAIHIWEAATGVRAATLEGHTSWISTLRFSPDGAHLFSAAADQTVQIWQTIDWKQSAVLRGHSDEIWSLNFAGDGLISGGKNGEVMFWPGGTAPQTAGRFEFPASTHEVVDAGDGGDLIELSSSFATRYTPGIWRGGPPYPLPAGIMNYNLRGILATREPDEKVRILDAAAHPPQQLALLDMEPYQTIFFDTAGRWLVFPHETNAITVFDIPSRTARRLAMQGSPEGIGFDAAAGKIAVWTYDRGAKQSSFQIYDDGADHWMEPRPCPGLFGTLRVVDERFRWVAMLAGSKVGVARISPFETLLDLTQENRVPAVAFSREGNWVAIASEAAWARLWRLPEEGAPKEPRILRGHLNAVHGLTFTADSTRLVTLCSNQEAAKFWDVVTGLEVLTLSGNSTFLQYARFSGNGETLLASRPGSGNTWQAWHAPSLEAIAAAEKIQSW